MNRRESQEWVDMVGLSIAHLHPKVKMELARSLLASLIDNSDITYGNFESAMSAERHIKRAYKELDGIA